MSAPTERQIAFAVSLGIKIPVGVTRESLSEKISNAKTREDDPPTKLQVRLAESWDVDGMIDEDDTRGDVAGYLFDAWEDDNDLDLPDYMVEPGLRSSGPQAKRGSKSGCLLVFIAAVTAAGFVAMF